MITSRQKAEKSGADGEKCWSAARVPVTPRRAISHTQLKWVRLFQMWMQKVVYSKWAPVIGLCESDLDLCVWATYLFSGVVKLRRSASASWLKLQTDKIDVDSFWFITIHSKKGNTFTSSVLRARGGTQDMWTWITRQKLETLDKKSTRLGLQRQLLIPSKLTLTVFQYPNYHTVRYARFGMSQYEVCEMQYAKKVRMSHYI